jgi:hypothetical protein
MQDLKDVIVLAAVGTIIYLMLYFGCLYMQRNLKQPLVQNLPAPIVEQLSPLIPSSIQPQSAPRQGLVPPPPPMVGSQ